MSVCVCVRVCARISIDICVCVYISKVIEDEPKAPFSIATTPRCGGERYSFPWIAPLYP